MRSAFVRAKRAAVPDSERAPRACVLVVTVVTSDGKAARNGRRLPFRGVFVITLRGGCRLAFFLLVGETGSLSLAQGRSRKVADHRTLWKVHKVYVLCADSDKPPMPINQ